MFGLTPRRMFGTSAACLLLLWASASVQAAKQMEQIDRGAVAVAADGGVFISWRWLGLESSDLAFNVYRNGTKLNSSPIGDRTNYFDDGGTTEASYQVRAVVDGSEDSGSSVGSVWSEPYRSVPLQRPAGGVSPDGVSYDYSPNDASVGDLDGDGEYEYIVKWYPSNAKDNSQSGYTGNTLIDAYELDGEFLWRIDLGRNIRSGAHYTQFIVYDLDGDGKAEVATKTADGSVDGQGNVIGSRYADYRNNSGYVLSGPEFLSVFDGETGAEMETVDYVPARGNVSAWGDSYGNRVDRFLAGVAYLNGAQPSLIMARGVYTRSVIAAWDWRDGRLSQRWVFDTDYGYSAYTGQGAHSLAVGDVDSDGRDEIVYGAMTVDDDGSGLYSTGLGTGDALHLGDLDPQRPGQEVYMVHEEPAAYGSHGVEMHDARTGTILWSRDGNGEDVGRGVSMDIDPRYAGNENWASRNGLVAANGTQISYSNPSQINFGVFWDGDLSREMLDGEAIDKWNYSRGQSSRLLTASSYGALSNNGSKATPALSADLFGDWREEVIWRHSNNRELLVFTTTEPSEHRLRTLMHDPQYRVSIAWQNVAYNQPPHTSFFLGYGMEQPSQPDIYYAGDSGDPDPDTEITIQENTLGFCSVDGTVDSDNSGFSGSGFANTSNNAGTGVDWRIDAGTDGNYSIGFRYAAYTSQSARLIVNGSEIAQVQMPGTGGYSSWNEVSTSVSLAAGIQDIRLESTGAYGLGNLDYIKIAGGEVAPTSCSSVIPDPEPEPEPEPLPTLTLTVQESSAGFCSVDGNIGSLARGYTGSGYANTDNAEGTGVEWAINIPADGDYQIDIRYAASGSRSAALLVDGSVASSMAFPSTGSWTTWNTDSSSVFLSEGNHQLRLEATNGGGTALIDRLAITGAEPVAGTCQ